MEKYSKEQTEILKELDIKNFHYLTSDHYIQLHSLLKKYPIEIQKEIIRQVPNFTQMINSIISTLSATLNNLTIAENEESKEFYNTCNIRIEHMKKILDSDDELTFEQKIEILHEMKEVNELQFEMHKYNKNENTKRYLRIAELCISLFAGIFGGFFLGSKISKDSTNEENNDDIIDIE